MAVSSSPVGSSARTKGGSFARAAARATLCCSPPLSSPGLWPILSPRPTTSTSSFTLEPLFSLGMPRATMGSSMFSAAVRVGIRFIVWKTWPTLFLRYSTSSPGPSLVSSWPKTLTLPAEALSRPPMMLSRVVFPEPDGPIRATISPSSTLRSSPLRACTSKDPCE